MAKGHQPYGMLFTYLISLVLKVDLRLSSSILIVQHIFIFPPGWDRGKKHGMRILCSTVSISRDAWLISAASIGDVNQYLGAGQRDQRGSGLRFLARSIQPQNRASDESFSSWKDGFLRLPPHENFSSSQLPRLPTRTRLRRWLELLLIKEFHRTDNIDIGARPGISLATCGEPDLRDNTIQQFQRRTWRSWSRPLHFAVRKSRHRVT